MTPRQDPYRVLGLVPGATAGEIRSAYRRLAKLNHPDTAGDRSLPRFLAIKAAYEELVDGDGRLRSRDWPGRSGGTGAGRPSGSTANRASREAWRARRTGGGPSGGGGTAGGPSGGGGAAEANAPRAGAAGATESKARSGSGASQGGKSGQDTKAGQGRTAGSGPTPGQGPRAGSGARAGRSSRDAGSRSRERRTARPGSTTYDEAAQPLDPSWEGGAWYGASSGSYWTLNPREYADPRKHGPEYQERARRAAQLEAAQRAGRAAPPDPAEGAAPSGPVSTPPPTSPAARPPDPMPRYRRVADRPGEPDGA